MSTDELTKIATFIFNSQWIQYPEFNLSCPNIIGSMQLGYNVDDTNEAIIHLKGVNIQFFKFFLVKSSFSTIFAESNSELK